MDHILSFSLAVFLVIFGCTLLWLPDPNFGPSSFNSEHSASPEKDEKLKEKARFLVNTWKYTRCLLNCKEVYMAQTIADCVYICQPHLYRQALDPGPPTMTTHMTRTRWRSGVAELARRFSSCIFAVHPPLVMSIRRQPMPEPPQFKDRHRHPRLEGGHRHPQLRHGRRSRRSDESPTDRLNLRNAPESAVGNFCIKSYVFYTLLGAVVLQFVLLAIMVGCYHRELTRDLCSCCHDDDTNVMLDANHSATVELKRKAPRPEQPHLSFMESEYSNTPESMMNHFDLWDSEAPSQAQGHYTSYSPAMLPMKPRQLSMNQTTSSPDFADGNSGTARPSVLKTAAARLFKLPSSGDAVGHSPDAFPGPYERPLPDDSTPFKFPRLRSFELVKRADRSLARFTQHLREQHGGSAREAATVEQVFDSPHWGFGIATANMTRPNPNASTTSKISQKLRERYLASLPPSGEAAHVLSFDKPTFRLSSSAHSQQDTHIAPSMPACLSSEDHEVASNASCNDLPAIFRAQATHLSSSSAFSVAGAHFTAAPHTFLHGYEHAAGIGSVEGHQHGEDSHQMRQCHVPELHQKAADEQVIQSQNDTSTETDQELGLDADDSGTFLADCQATSSSTESDSNEVISHAPQIEPTDGNNDDDDGIALRQLNSSSAIEQLPSHRMSSTPSALERPTMSGCSRESGLAAAGSTCRTSIPFALDGDVWPDDVLEPSSWIDADTGLLRASDLHTLGFLDVDRDGFDRDSVHTVRSYVYNWPDQAGRIGSIGDDEWLALVSSAQENIWLREDDIIIQPPSLVITEEELDNDVIDESSLTIPTDKEIEDRSQKVNALPAQLEDKCAKLGHSKQPLDPARITDENAIRSVKNKKKKLRHQHTAPKPFSDITNTK
ncbi:uncharacterized protein LOC135828360 [Sycon ciliatum]|uniref:uncharacterized protein LOC135828360 n=1 Tax=Sycon ciliatum TaxID=27933 RepID=UPI0031F69ABA